MNSSSQFVKRFRIDVVEILSGRVWHTIMGRWPMRLDIIAPVVVE
jgi:hypothetical protein